MLIARLIADSFPEGTGDCESRLDALAASCAKADMPIASATVIDNAERLVEIRYAHGQAAQVLARIDEAFDPVDALVAEDDIVVPRLFVSDMDSTMIGQECIDELADFAGLKPQIAAITERAMQGELDFTSALQERVALLEGLGEDAIARCLAERITPTPGAQVLTATLKARGARTVLVTGGFHHFADPVAETIGFERVVGNRLAVSGGALTGACEGEICDADTKRAVLREESRDFGSSARTMAIGDGANDIPMIEAADYGFAYRAKPAARAAANGRIERCDLTAILTLLGIARKDWVAA
ncbi:phosphoserine phosphatase SerB [Qipengyuania nanhaisediminis]|uniref:phosphoserine phosphatase SerB n=1 Tax=Qipengyuania nanhaisediminis TaxID=604088 RepID=UPI0038B2D180